MLAFSLTVVIALYAVFLVLDIWLMRRYASYRTEGAPESDELTQPALGF
jgi:cytochrome bd-type quinol oxidase subunit 1